MSICSIIAHNKYWRLNYSFAVVCLSLRLGEKEYKKIPRRAKSCGLTKPAYYEEVGMRCDVWNRRWWVFRIKTFQSKKIEEMILLLLSAQQQDRLNT